MTEGLGMKTVPIALEPSGRALSLPKRILNSVILRPLREFRPRIWVSFIGIVKQQSYHLPFMEIFLL